MSGVRATIELVGVLLAAILVQGVLALVFAGIITVLGSDPQSTAASLGVLVFGELGFVLMAYAYLSSRPYGFPAIRVPSLQEGRFVLIGPLLGAVVTVALGVVLMRFGSPTDYIVGGGRIRSFGVRLAFAAASILVIGPAEEAFFRGAFHQTLRTYFSTTPVVIIATTLFVLVHIPNVLGASLPIAISGLAAVTALSLVAGYSYEITDNLSVPILVHGLYNAVLFLLPAVL